MTDHPQPSLIPHSIQAEEAVIGAILINPDAYYDVAQFLRGEDFYIHRHRFIWEAINRLHESHAPVDILTLTEELDRVGQCPRSAGRPT
jgi:replicative DNA helicase